MRRRLVASIVPETWTPLRVWLTAFLAFFALSAGWALATPLTAAPDEPFHMVKAAATVRGQLHGAPVTVITHNLTATNHVGMTGYRLPSAYADLVNLRDCYDARNTVPASCAEHLTARPGVAVAGTTAGANNPLYYLAVGWPSLLSDGPAGMYGMRLVSAALCAAMLAGAVLTAFQWTRRRRYPMAAVLAAATPMVLFLNGSVNPNSLEASSAILLWAAVLKLLTDPQPELVPRLLTRAGLATLALVSVRQLGPAWALVIVVCAGLAGQRGVLRTLLWRPAVWFWTATIGVVGLGSVAWSARFNVLSGSTATYPNLTFSVAAKYTFSQSVNFLRQMVGFFGWLDVRAPFHLAELWFLPVLALIAGAVLAGRVREMLALAVLAVSVIAIPVLAQGRQAQSLGYIWQGRYLLAVAAGLPLLAAAILAKREPRWLAARRVVTDLPAVVTGTTLLLGFLMFYSTLRRYTVGIHGPVVSLSPSWSPPGSVLGVLLLYVVGAGLAALVVLAARAPYPEPVADGEPAGFDGPAGIGLPADVPDDLPAEHPAANGAPRAEDLLKAVVPTQSPASPREPDGPGDRSAAVSSSAT